MKLAKVPVVRGTNVANVGALAQVSRLVGDGALKPGAGLRPDEKERERRPFMGCVLVGIALTIGCGEGTSGWILQDRTMQGQSAAGGESGTGGGTALAGSSGLGGAGTAQGGTAGTGTGQGGSESLDVNEVCSPEFVVTNRDADGDGRLFDENLSDPEGTLLALSHRTCELLYRQNQEVPRRTRIEVIVEDSSGVGHVDLGESSTIYLNSHHLRNIEELGENVGAEIRGVLCFLLVTIYQYQSGVRDAQWATQGIGNYVRHHAGYYPIENRPDGGSYEYGYGHSGFFFVWIEERYPGFIYGLNQSFAPSNGGVWDPTTFEKLTSRDVDDLWQEYQKSF